MTALIAAENRDEARATRHPWAWLLKRVFAAEVLVCVHCAGHLRLVEIATEPEADLAGASAIAFAKTETSAPRRR